MKTSKRIKLLLLLVAIGSYTLSSCLKGGEPTEIQAAKVFALNAVPDSEGFDIGLDQNQINDPASKGKDFGYGDTIGYLNAFPGTRLVRVFEVERDTYDPPITQGNINLKPGNYYTLYVVGQKESTQLIATHDDMSTPGTGKSKIRFINLSPDAPKLNLGIEGEDNFISSNKAFKEYSTFTEIDGDKEYTFEITNQEDSKRLTSFSLTTEAGKIYTIWSKGVYNSDEPEPTIEHGIIVYPIKNNQG